MLLHFVWQGAVIALALAVLLALTSAAQARLRYALSCGALTLMLVAALATAATVMTRRSTTLPRPSLAVEASAPDPSRSPDAAGNASVPEGQGRARPTPAEPAPDGASPAPARTCRRWRGRSSKRRCRGWSWPGRSVSCSSPFVLLGGWWRTRAPSRRRRLRRFPTWCRAQLDALSSRLRIARPVAIVASVRVSVPVVLGHLKPVIVLPAAVLAGLEPGAARSHPRARARARPPPRLSGEPRADRDRDAALLSSGRLVGVASGARGARALLRRSRRDRLRQPRRLRPRAARPRGARGSQRHCSRSEPRTVHCSPAARRLLVPRGGSRRRRRVWPRASSR